MDQRRGYVASFLEESLGLAAGDVDPEGIPSELVQSICSAVKGDASAASEQPLIEKQINACSDEIRASILETRGFILRKSRWPNGARYAVCLTHDVDNLSRPLSHILARRNRFSATDLILAVLGLRNLYDNIALFSGLEASRAVRSSFYLLTSNYDLAKKSTQLRELRGRGWDIGLHGDFGTHDSEQKMAEAVSRFKSATGVTPVGVREHFLRFDFGSTWGIMDGAGFAYDSSVGNTDKLGFRLGLCTPFHPPDAEWKPRRILELPLVLMDTTLWGYLKRTEREGLSDIESMRDRVADVNGLFTILWHPDAARMKGGRLYPSVLDALKGQSRFMGSGNEIAGWWSRRCAPLRLEGGSYRMEDAPEGLVMEFKAKDGLKAVAKGGVLSTEGDRSVVRAAGGPISVEVR